MLDYLAWRGDITLRERAFNEVDNLILATLAYLNMKGLVPGPESGETVPMPELLRRYEAAGYDQSDRHTDALPLLKQAADTRRFGTMRVGAYVDVLDEAKQSQFSASAWYLEDDSVYVAFRGTDGTIAGWHEDFNLSYLSETPAQSEAVHYLDRAAERTAGPIRVGGHSKGGNLAVYAAAFCGEAARERIVTVYSDDGPGFNSAISGNGAYQAILDRVELIVPESSFVGILMSNKEEKHIVKSSASGPWQHDPYTWQVRGAAFETVDALSDGSAFMDETLDRWVEEMDAEQMEQLTSAIFGSVKASGASTFRELHASWRSSYLAVLDAVRKLDPIQRRGALDSLRKLLTAGEETAQDEARKLLMKFLQENGIKLPNESEKER